MISYIIRTYNRKIQKNGGKRGCSSMAEHLLPNDIQCGLKLLKSPNPPVDSEYIDAIESKVVEIWATPKCSHNTLKKSLVNTPK